MVDKLTQWEQSLFLALNGSNSTFWDNFFYVYSYKWTWIPFYAIILLAVILYKKSWKVTLLTIVSIALLILCCDQVSSAVIKPLVARPRPTHNPDIQHYVNTVFLYTGGKYGFVSSHAANSFGLTIFLSYYFRHKLTIIALSLYALLTAYSRIYLGVHYISDVVAGGLIGLIIGYGIYRLFKVANEYFNCKREETRYSQSHSYYIGLFYAICVILILVFNHPLAVWMHH
jgi:undecaprenyl-diphosphatase